MEIILIGSCLLYLAILVFWAYKQSKKRQRDLDQAWEEYSDSLLQLSKNPNSEELKSKTKELGLRFYQYKIPDSYGPSVYTPVHPLSDAIPPWDRSSVNYIDNSEAREKAIEADISSKCCLDQNDKKAA